MQATLSSASVKTLTLNSLPPTNPNLQQPDMWTSSKYPLYFPQHAPTADPNHPMCVFYRNANLALASRTIAFHWLNPPPPPHHPSLSLTIIRFTFSPINPTTQKIVLGSRLSLEDFMSLRSFCLELFLHVRHLIYQVDFSYLSMDTMDGWIRSVPIVYA